MKGYEKWSDYKIGQIKFVNRNRDHPHRQVFIDFVTENCDSVLEIGPGELIEYQVIKKQKPPIQYAAVDVSDLFVSHCKQNFPEITVIQNTMEDFETDQEFDVVYGSSVLEHSYDVVKCVNNIVSKAKKFHFVLFEWHYEGDLTAKYHPPKKYWTSEFNIWMLLDVIREVGDIDQINLVCRNGDIIDFQEYSKDKTGMHRNGDYLIIHGRRK